MRSESFDFLKSIEETPSVSGYEMPVARLVRKRMEKHADTITTDLHGNVICCLNPKGSPRIMLAGHMDQIGLMINHVTDDGFCYFRNVGGIDATVLPGSRVTVHSKKGPVEGVIGRKPVHLMKPEEKGNAKIELHDLWIDIGASTKADALARVSIADVATYKLGLTKIGDGLIASPGLDNKVGTFVVMEALRLASEMKLKCALYAVATVQEEIGLRGARTSCYGIDPTIGIAVDVTHATDCPTMDLRQQGDIKLGGGPVIERGPNVNPKLFTQLVETAKRKAIGHQLAAHNRGTGTDANAIQLVRAGVVTGLISIPNRYMHSGVELVSLDDLESAAKLLSHFLIHTPLDADWTP